LRAVRARLDPAWTADGYVSDRWRPVSPVTGRLDAFQWQTPLASLPSDKGTTIESSPFEEAMLAAPSPPRELTSTGLVEPPRDAPADAAPPAAMQDNAPPLVKAKEPAAPVSLPPAEPQSAPPTPLFRARADLSKPATAPIPPVIPIVRPPDDPGVDDEAPSDEFVEQIGTSKAQAGGWRGFWARWGGS
jgi:HemY protein